jgi:hypothetical protein
MNLSLCLMYLLVLDVCFISCVSGLVGDAGHEWYLSITSMTKMNWSHFYCKMKLSNFYDENNRHLSNRFHVSAHVLPHQRSRAATSTLTCYNENAQRHATCQPVN